MGLWSGSEELRGKKKLSSGSGDWLLFGGQHKVAPDNEEVGEAKDGNVVATDGGREPCVVGGEDAQRETDREMTGGDGPRSPPGNLQKLYLNDLKERQSLRRLYMLVCCLRKAVLGGKFRASHDFML